ncbi:extracellular solute-binding protein [Kineococcus sp. R8]|uniref:sugar ABC transporter substrate-binding protein n=1 Tax=Kineococcus siccus TaxID=2696567 RepID=UPI001413662B|nr:extracellular solute-binding protein [Kineococcus siccus]NAZ84130.1 extracellular solute-binding protein [Kineococcus siccus]
MAPQTTSSTPTTPARPLGRRPLLAAALASPLAVSACGGSETGSAGGAVTQVTALDYYQDEPGRTDWTNRLTAAGKAAGVTVDHQSVKGDTLIAKVLQQSSAKTLPDLLMLDNPDLQEIASSGILTPLSDYGIDTAGYAQGILDTGTYEGKVYGLAPTVNTISLFFNTDVLTAAGVAPPTTWDELKTAAATLTKGEQYGFAFDANATYEGTWQFLPFFWSAGGDLEKLDAAEGVEALQLWVDLVEAGSVSKSVVNWDQSDVMEQFAAGKAAMMVNGPWQIPTLKEKYADVKWDVVKIPVPKAGDESIAPLGGEVWTVPLTTPERQAKAGEMLKTLLEPASMLEMAKKDYKIPSLTAVADEYAGTAPEMEIFAEQVTTARSRTSQLGDKWPKTAEAIYTAIQSALTGSASAQEAMSTAQESASAS